MNVKMTEHSITFKITEAELSYLVSGAVLEKQIPLGESGFTMAIDSRGYNFQDSGLLPMAVVMDRENCCLTLYARIEEIEKLSEMGKSRDGIMAHDGNVDIFLQVDFRHDSRPRKQ